MSRRARRVSLRAIRRSRRSRSSSRWSPSRASCSEATRLAPRAWSRVRRCGGGTPTAAYRQARDGRVRMFVLAAPSLGSTPFRSRPPPTEILLYSAGATGGSCRSYLPSPLSPPPHQGLSDRRRTDEQARRTVQPAKPHSLRAREFGHGRRAMSPDGQPSKVGQAVARPTIRAGRSASRGRRSSDRATPRAGR